MSDAQQEMSPDFVLMRLVSAAEYDRLDEPEDLVSVKAVLGHHGGGVSGGFELDPSGPSTGLGSASPHYSSPLRGKGELDGGLLLTQASPGSDAPLSPSPTEDFAVAAQRFVDFPVPHGSGAQLMVFQNLLRSGDRILECGLEQPPPGYIQESERQTQHLDSGTSTGLGSTTSGPGLGGGKEQNSQCVTSAAESQQPQLLQWHPLVRLSKGSDGSQTPQDVPVLESESRSVLCHRHRLLTDRLAKWPPSLLDQALRLGLLDPRKSRSAGGDDPVLVLARRLGHLGEARDRSGGEDVLPVPRCSCHSVLASGTGGMGPGEDPSETSDALLVLEGLGSEDVGGLGDGGEGDGGDLEDTEKGERVGVGGGGSSGGTLSGLMQQVHRLAEEAGVCTDQSCRSSLAVLGAAVSRPPCVDPHPSISHSPTPCLFPHFCPPPPQAAAPLQVSPDSLPASSPILNSRPQHQHQSRSQPQSRAATPKLGLASAGRSASPLVVLEGDLTGAREGEKTPHSKSRKGGSLKVRLSKLFRTKSTSGSSGGLLDKRPSLASSTSSGGSLLDVWGSTCSNTEQDGTR